MTTQDYTYPGPTANNLRAFPNKNGKRQLLKGIDKGYLYRDRTNHESATHLKIPVNVGGISWKVLKLYIKYLDLKAQSPDLGTFQIYHSKRHYQRTIKALIEKGWAWRADKKVYLKAYQEVWRSMGIERVTVNGISRFRYWKIPVEIFPNERTDRKGADGKIILGYQKEIEMFIKKKITKRKLAQLRFALKDKGEKNTATFSAKSAASSFGYKSVASGSKLRKEFMELVPQTAIEAKPYFNRVKGRFEENTKRVAI